MLKLMPYLFFIFCLAFALPASAVSVSEAEIVSAVREEFAAEGIDDELDIEVYGGKTSFVFTSDSPARIMVYDLKYDEEQSKFSCRAEIYLDGALAASSDLSGKFYRMTEISVPSRNIRKGELLSAADLQTVRVRRSRIKDNNIVEASRLIGKEARRALKEGKMILSSEVGARTLIHKGDVVTAIYASGPMQISVKVEAVTEGEEGEKIELINSKSGKTLFGKIIDAETVKVDAQ